jgi:hypothetical protein
LDPFHFDNLARRLSHASPRRRLLGGLAGGALGLVTTRLPGVVAAKKKRKHKKRKAKKAKSNTFGCVSVGKACGRDGHCCSGICEGKAGKKQCQAHGTGTCDQAAEGFCTAADPEQTHCNDSSSCACMRTTGDNTFCADLDVGRGGACADCKTDADCEARGFPPGSACIPFTEGICPDAAVCEFGTFCLPSCAVKPPEA